MGQRVDILCCLGWMQIILGRRRPLLFYKLDIWWARLFLFLLFSHFHLIDFINIIEKNLRIKAKINFLPLQNGDVLNTSADLFKINELVNYSPKVTINDGIASFISWYKSYYNIWWIKVYIFLLNMIEAVQVVVIVLISTFHILIALILIL